MPNSTPDVQASTAAILAALGRGHYAPAEAQARTHTLTFPTDAFGWKVLGALLKIRGQWEAALLAMRHALRLQPDDVESYHNIGLTLRDLQRSAEAEAALRTALAILPTRAESHSTLALILNDQGHVAAAEQSLRQALALDPHCPKAHSHLGVVLKEQGRTAEAVACYRQELVLHPKDVDAHSNLLLNLQYDTEQELTEAFAEACAYGEKVSRKATAPFTTWHCPAQPQRLRIGLVSGDLHDHPVGQFTATLTAAIDRNRLELLGYPTRARADGVTDRIRSHCTAWRSLEGLSDKAAAQLIHTDGVHILIDLAGHTGHNRLPVFAWKPAPIQATWLGYPATTGMTEIDYFIGDPHSTPPESAPFFTETLWPLPEALLCYTPRSAPPVAPLPALRNGYLTFGCFNNLTKLSDATVALWAQLLTQLPTTRLFLRTKQLADVAIRERTMQRFAAQGIAPERLRLEGWSAAHSDFLAAYNDVDLQLDPFPYNGTTTSIEGLWMGVPLLTIRGNRLVSRMGHSINQAAGLADWTAIDAEEFIAKAQYCADHLEVLADIRAGLRAQLQATPLLQAERFAAHFVDGLWAMWAEKRDSCLRRNDEGLE